MASITDAVRVSPSRTAFDFESRTVFAPTTETFRNTGREFLLVRNPGASSADLTITTYKTVDGCAVDDKTLTIGAGESHLIGPFPTEYYNDGDDEVTLTFTDTGAPDCELTVILPT